MCMNPEVADCMPLVFMSPYTHISSKGVITPKVIQHGRNNTI
jgi:hypothetical protein